MTEALTAKVQWSGSCGWGWQLWRDSQLRQRTSRTELQSPSCHWRCRVNKQHRTL